MKSQTDVGVNFRSATYLNSASDLISLNLYFLILKMEMIMPNSPGR